MVLFVPVWGETPQSHCLSPEFEGHGLLEHRALLCDFAETLRVLWTEIGGAVC